MFWKFVIASLVLPCCLGFETASATLRKDVQIPAQSEFELLSTEIEGEVDAGETIPAINQHDYKISHHRRRYHKRRHYQRRNHNHRYRRVNYHRSNYQNCPRYRSRRVNYHPASYRQEAYPMHDMIYRRHYYRRH